MLGYNGERITFPLFDKNNNVIAFSNRIIGNSVDHSSGKYINSKNDKLFQKGSYLYGINLLDTSLSYAYITEGQMDVIAAHKYKMKNVLASLGTAFTEKHLETLKKYPNIKNLIFVFDGDDAGAKALERSAIMARKMGYAVSYVELPNNMDLFDFAMFHEHKLCYEINNRTLYYFYKELEEYQKEVDNFMHSVQSRIMTKSIEIDKSLSNEAEKSMFYSYLRMCFQLDMEKRQ